jgi:hypothetical protein
MAEGKGAHGGIGDPKGINSQLSNLKAERERARIEGSVPSPQLSALSPFLIQ